MSIEEWASLVATQALNQVSLRYGELDANLAAMIADEIDDAIDALWAIKPE